MSKELKGIKLIPVDRPTESGFYIKYNHVPWGQSTTVVAFKEDLQPIKEIGDSGNYHIEDIYKYDDYKWIQIKIEKPKNNLPAESGMYWVWREGCIADKIIVYYNAEGGGHYQTVGDSASYSVIDIQEYNWQKVSEPSIE